ncbi:hypothetical protein [Paenibacillus sp. RC67]|uniref:hypothetical protein n=1 Tax=Paenibacillus sp. RC67 TaxID=3039392 RepID=UPI0024ACE57D|nr:hypothetical protein [Paenibacillus sp. RC67]
MSWSTSSTVMPAASLLLIHARIDSSTGFCDTAQSMEQFIVYRTIQGIGGGALMPDQINWRWIFYINLPFGIISLWFIAQFYRETLHLKKLKIDWFGALTLVGAVVSFMSAFELGGNRYAWDSTPILS